MRTVSHALFMLLLLNGSCACPQPSTSETPSGGGTSPDLDPGTAPATPTSPTTPAAGGTAGGGDRTLAVAASDPLYARVEGTSFQNGCQSDGQCFVGGCSSEICSAEQGVSGTCDMPAAGFPSKGATCGCLSGQCVWYRTGAATPASGTGSSPSSGSGAASGPGAASGSKSGPASGPGSGSGPGSASGQGPASGPGSGKKPDKSGGTAGGGALPKQGENCTADYKCAAGLTCKRYRGIAGAAGPEFKTCEIPCTGKGSTCPAGQTCVTIADGPGQVCRP